MIPHRTALILRALSAALLTGAGLATPATWAQGGSETTDSEAPWTGVMERLKLYGDVRLRHESSFQLVGKKDRHRERLRFRLGANYAVDDELLFGARLVTGDREDPKSPHVTFGDGFDGLEFTLDRAFLTYRPSWLEGARFTGGKFGHPFRRNPVYGELVWDADVQPEGLVTDYTASDVGPFSTLTVAAGSFFLLEQSGGDDAYALAGQVAGSLDLTEDASGSIALGYHHYGDPTPDGAVSILSENTGNAVVDIDGDTFPDRFVSDFGILNPIVSVDYGGWALPARFSVEYVKNTRAEIDRDEAWAAGFSVGRSSNRGDWRGYYQWQIVEEDAVFSPVAQDDFLLTTNHRSHLAGINYQLSDKIGLHLWALVSARDHTSPGPTTMSDDEQWRVRLDLNVKL